MIGCCNFCAQYDLFIQSISSFLPISIIHISFSYSLSPFLSFSFSLPLSLSLPLCLSLFLSLSQSVSVCLYPSRSVSFFVSLSIFVSFCLSKIVEKISWWLVLVEILKKHCSKYQIVFLNFFKSIYYVEVTDQKLTSFERSIASWCLISSAFLILLLTILGLLLIGGLLFHPNHDDTNESGCKL